MQATYLYSILHIPYMVLSLVQNCWNVFQKPKYVQVFQTQHLIFEVLFQVDLFSECITLESDGEFLNFRKKINHSKDKYYKVISVSLIILRSLRNTNKDLEGRVETQSEVSTSFLPTGKDLCNPTGVHFQRNEQLSIHQLPQGKSQGL